MHKLLFAAFLLLTVVSCTKEKPADPPQTPVATDTLFVSYLYSIDEENVVNIIRIGESIVVDTIASFNREGSGWLYTAMDQQSGEYFSLYGGHSSNELVQTVNINTGEKVKYQLPTDFQRAPVFYKGKWYRLSENQLVEFNVENGQVIQVLTDSIAGDLVYAASHSGSLYFADETKLVRYNLGTNIMTEFALPPASVVIGLESAGNGKFYRARRDELLGTKIYIEEISLSGNTVNILPLTSFEFQQDSDSRSLTFNKSTRKLYFISFEDNFTSIAELDVNRGTIRKHSVPGLLWGIEALK